jgi:hypothetical protein
MWFTVYVCICVHIQICCTFQLSSAVLFLFFFFRYLRAFTVVHQSHDIYRILSYYSMYMYSFQCAICGR